MFRSIEKTGRMIRISGGLLVGIAIVLLLVNLLVDRSLNIALPLVFLMLAAVFYNLAEILIPRWPLAAYLHLPASLLLAFGIIFLINVLTQDWNAWSYAWMLLVAGLGGGLLLAGRTQKWRSWLRLSALGLLVFGLTFFAIFGAIVGGLFIQVMAPLLLASGGALLFWLKPEILLPPRLLARLKASHADAGELPIPTESGQPSGPVLSTPPSSAPPLAEALSARELEVLGWIEQGLSNQEIAARLTVAPSTIKTHINNIYSKLDVKSRAQALKKARDLRLI